MLDLERSIGVCCTSDMTLWDKRNGLAETVTVTEKKVSLCNLEEELYSTSNIFWH